MNIKDIAKKVSPNAKERRQMEEVKSKIESALRKIVKKYTLIDKFAFAGSFAKDTWVAGHNEFDVFLVFSKKADASKLEKQGLDCGKKLATELGGKQQLVYASHPYSLITLPNKYSLDLVPCYAVNSGEKIISAVDRSLLHVDFVKKAIKHNHNYAVEIRLLKQFLKRFDLYGADDVFQGFSGYLAELLVIFYGSFEKVMENAAKLHYGELISFSNLKKDKISQRFPDSPLIVIDPTDENRNVAANLSSHVFDNFVLYSNLYLNAPKNKKEQFFFKQEGLKGNLKKTKIKFKKANKLKEIIKKRGTYWVFLKIDLAKKDLPINIYPKIRRLMKNISAAVVSFGFVCLNSWFFVETQQAILAFEFPSETLGFFERKIGPPLYNQPQLLTFLKHHTKNAMRFFASDGKICAELPRQHPNVSALIAFLLQQKKVGMAEDLSEAISSKHFSFVKESQLCQKCRAQLADFLSNKFEDFVF